MDEVKSNDSETTVVEPTSVIPEPVPPDVITSDAVMPDVVIPVQVTATDEVSGPDTVVVSDAGTVAPDVVPIVEIEKIENIGEEVSAVDPIVDVPSILPPPPPTSATQPQASPSIEPVPPTPRVDATSAEVCEPKVVEKIVEKVVEKEVVREVEKVVEKVVEKIVYKPATPTADDVEQITHDYLLALSKRGIATRHELMESKLATILTLFETKPTLAHRDVMQAINCSSTTATRLLHILTTEGKITLHHQSGTIHGGWSAHYTKL